ncbi:hypothetical protein MRX96_039219 [Rhipicephalus microplus]
MRRVGGTVEVRSVGTDTCYSSSSSCSSSSDSEQNGFGAPRHLRGPTRRPGFQPPELHRLLKMRQGQVEVRGDLAACGDGAGSTIGSSAAAAFPLLERAQAAQGHGGFIILVMRGQRLMNRKSKTLLKGLAFFSVFAFFFGLEAAFSISIMGSGAFGSSFRTSRAEHADLPLFSGCEEWAWRNYMSAIELSLNRSQDPCNDFYRFVCDGWKHQQQLLSVVDVAEDAMYGRALNALAWNDNEGSSHQELLHTTDVERRE